MKTELAPGSSSRKFPLRTTLVVPFVLQIVAAVGLVGYLSFRNGQKAVTELANQLNSEIAARVEQTLKAYVAIPHQINQTNVTAVRIGELSLRNTAQLRRHFWNQSQDFPSVTSIAVGTEEREYKGIERLSNGEINIDDCDRSTNYSHVSYRSGKGGTLGRFLGVNKQNYDPRIRPWYKPAAETRRPAWSPIYTYINAANRLAVTSGYPLYDANGNFLGVMSSDFTLPRVSKFLEGVKVGRTGQIFIIERSGLLVANSTTEQPFKTANSGSKAERLEAVNSRNPTTQAAARQLKTKFSDFNQIEKAQQLKFEISGKQQFLQVLPFQDGNGLDWLIVVVVPESDFMAQINANTRTTLLLCLGALGLATVLGIITAQWITQPIDRVSRASEAMATGNLDQHVESNNIIEIEKLATSFNSMAGQLKESFETLEDKVKERTAELASANEEIIVLNEKLKEDNLRLGAELDLVRQMQQMILPNAEELEIEGLDIAGYMEPADEVGGDYYDVLHTDGVVTLGIGDVTGHGLESGILMLMAQTSVRTLQEIREADPVRFLDVLNRTLYKNVQRMNSEKSLTLALLNYSQGRVSISGQHEETLVVRKGGEIERVDTMELGFPLALDDDIAGFISQVSIELQPGDGVVLYTDGIPEAYDIDKQQYGMERMCEVISQNWQLSAKEIEQAIIVDVRRHIGTQKVFDDITLLVFKRLEVIAENPVPAQDVALV